MQHIGPTVSENLPSPSGQPPQRILFPAVLALASAVLSALLMPRAEPFPYHYQLGQPWNYGALSAPFDFEVLRPEAEVAGELAQAKTELGPYFFIETEVARRQKKAFGALVDEQVRISRNDAEYEDLVRSPTSYRAVGQQLLDALYLRGIADPRDGEAFRDQPGFVFVVTEGGSERRIPVREVLSLKSARDVLTDSLPFSPLRQPQLILPLLEKSLVPNLHYSDSLTSLMRQRKLASILGTGITVRKGEVIVQRNELVSRDLLLKLNSLSRRYDMPEGLGYRLGYGLLALAAFSLFFFWLIRSEPVFWGSRMRAAALSAWVLGALLALQVAGRFGLAVPLLLPFWALPVLLRKTYGLTVSVVLTLLFTTLGGIALEWGGAWLLLQLTGLAGVLIFYQPANSPKSRVFAAALTAVFQIAVWMACRWSGRLPDGLRSPDVVLFILAAATLSMGFYLFRRPAMPR